MIKRSLRVIGLYALEAIAVLFALVLFAGGALLWRLAQGPMELDFLMADAQERLGAAFEGDLVSLSSLEARFDTETGLLFISARDVTVAEEGGTVLTRAPLIEAGFGLDSFLSGHFAPSQVAIEGGAVAIVRRADGAVGAGLGTPERVALQARPPGSGRDVDAILELLRNPGDNALLGRLTDVSIHSASIRVVDAVNQLDWYVDEAELRLARDAERLRGDLAGRFATTAGFAAVALRLEAGADLDTFLMEIRADNLSPRAIAPLSGPFASAGQISAPINLEAFASASRREGIRAASVNLSVGAGQIGRGEAAQQIRGLTAVIDYEPVDGAIRISELDVDSDILDTSLTGRIYDLREFDDAFPRRWLYELDIEEGRLDLGGVFEAPPEWLGIRLSGEMNARDFEIGFESLVAEIGPITARLEGLARLRQLETGEWLPDIRLTGPVEGEIPPDLVLRYWPVELADGARDWVEGAIIGARISDAAIDLDLNAESLLAGRLANERMALSFAFEDAAFRYISTMTPVTGARGRATLFGNSFSLEMSEGLIGETPVRHGFVDIPRLNPRGAVARFGGEARASAQAVLSLIDEEPLNLVSDYGLDPQAITGQGDVRFEIRRPMLRDVPVEDVGFDIHAVFTDVTMDTGVRNMVLTGGDVELIATPDAIEAAGTASLGEARARIRWVETFGLEDDASSTVLELEAQVPASALDRFGLPVRRYVDGVIGVELSTLGDVFDFERITLHTDLTSAEVELPGGFFVKPADEAAIANAEIVFTETGEINIQEFDLQADGLDAEATAQFGPDGRLLAADVSRIFIDNYIDASASASRLGGVEGPLALAVTGAYFDAASLISNLSDFSGTGGAPPPLGLTVALDEVRVSPSVIYSDLMIDWQARETGEETLVLRADTGDGEFAIDLTAPAGGRREIVLSAPDFGELLRMLDLYQNVEGGALTITGSMPPAGQEGQSDYVVSSEDFTLVRMPVLARVLAAGSLPGLAALLSGDGGIAFEQLQANVSIRDDIISVQEARASGPSLGVTTEGAINMAGERLALDGVLAPSYGLNSLVGNLPLVGEALISRPGEGVIGITFSVEGPFGQPTVIANPLSVLAPGVLRRLFEGTAADRERERQGQDEEIDDAAPESLPEDGIEQESTTPEELVPDDEAEGVPPDATLEDNPADGDQPGNPDN
ncbi:AsmA-like C-terminal region-containing protein [Hyphobacterium sp. HN65]|uniref:AsmA-like C-terminal region-containing protein n=1 Tax=Hyphobacterium lacteum TaxID=3116575 RepID=A0ABU7LLM6_9PROT|nr:AsmA-like C-terminal region-containing protein [Hyphobacterium sp. HN65]MEE2524823.1 AsmA-like C-terminal region-containing protein [Hyphobacterium sp. HN65]